ncbi:MAG: hypothetical protein NTV62_04240 [Candidatus Gribaldobacteria bacterium]|nr:hypothetical protein [Candidatus Gribaldobacteria bacterium]
MIQQTIVRRQVFFFIADESDIAYNPSTKKQNARLERETTRAGFLVELLEKRGYEIGEIVLDFEGPKCEILGSVDLVALKNESPFLIAQFLRDTPSLTEIAMSRDVLWEKMRDLKAQYGVLAWANQKETFLSANGKIKRVIL